MKELLIFCIFIFYNVSYSQSIKGTIKDKNGHFIENCYVEFKEQSENFIKEFILVENGNFDYQLTKKYTKLSIEIFSSGYYSESITLNNLNTTNQVYITLIEEKEIILNEVIVISDKKDIVVKEDTLKYNVSKYRDGSERKIEDVLKKMPGIEVNDKTGEIKYKGKSIETVTLDGDNMFGNNYSLGTKNISVDLIDQVQAIDNYSENSLLKGIENSDKVSLNLKLKKGITDFSGEIGVGLGLNNDKQALAKTDTNILQISKSYKAIMLLNYNNIGENNSPYDFFSGNLNINEMKNNTFEAHKIIPDVLFSSFIDNERINNNNLFYATYNNLFKINNRLNIKANLLFLKDKINYFQNIETANFINNNLIATSDKLFSTKKPQVFNSGIDINYNTSKSSLLEYKIKLNSDKITTNSDILQNNITSITNTLETEKLTFFQNLVFTKKINSNYVFQTNLINSVSKTPQNLNLKTSDVNQMQNVAFDKNTFSGNISLLGKKNNFKFSFQLNYLSENFDLETNNSNFQVNNNNYISKTTSQSNFLTYQKNNWIISTSIILKNISQELSQTNNNESITFIEPTLSLKYKINTTTFLSTKIFQNRNTLLNNYLFESPIILSNRISTQNINNLTLQKNTSFNVFYSNNNVYRKLLLEIGYDFNTNEGNFLSQFNITENTTIINNIFSNISNKTHSFELKSVKYLSLICSTIKLKSNFSLFEYYNYVNSLDIRFNQGSNLSTDLSINTTFKSKINFENSINHSLTSNKNGNSEFKNISIINSFKTKYKFTKDIQVTLKADYFHPSLINNNNYLLVDFDFSFSTNKKNYELKFSIKNLFNEKTFSQIQVNDFSKTSIQNNLLPRFFLINFIYKL